MGTLYEEDHVATNTFRKNGLNFTIAKTLDINLSRLASISFADKPGETF